MITVIFALSLALIAVASPASAHAGPDSIAFCDESQGRSTATGIVSLTILQPPQICGDGICSRNEAWTSCPADCVLKPSQSFVGVMTGGISTSASGLILATGMTAFLFAMGFRTMPKKKDA